MINLNGIILFHNSSIIKFFMNFIFSQSMFDVALLDALTPLVIKVMDLASYLPAELQIVTFIHFRIASFTKQGQYQITVLQDNIFLIRSEATVLRILFISHSFVFSNIFAFLFFKHLQLVFDVLFICVKGLKLQLIDLFLLIFVDILIFSIF